MNILQIGTLDNAGGAASISWILKKRLEEKGYSMPMFVGTKLSDAPDVFQIPRTLHHYVYYALSNDINFSKTDWIMDTKEFKEADVIHIHNLHGWFFNLKTLERMSELKPIVWTLHDMWAITSHCCHSYDGKLKDGFYQCRSLSDYPRITWHNEKYLERTKRKIYNNSNINLVSPSMWLKEKVQHSVLKDKRMDLIYNGIDQTIFKPSDTVSTRQELKIPLDKKVVLFMSDGGKNNPFKGWDFVRSVVEEFKHDDTVLFICLGGKESGVDGTYKNLLYVPRIDSKELLSKYFSASDIFLYPSLADNCPLVVLEALACGMPVVTFNTGGIPELVEHLEDGYVAKYKDGQDLIKGVEYILGLSAEEIKAMQDRSRSKVMNYFTADNMVAQYEKVYVEIIQAFKKSDI
jgi:glycosyltransferase involved in cell wall biosynthesis